MLFLHLLPLLFVEVLCDGPVTIDQGDAYQKQRNCAFSCFRSFDDPGYPIAMTISCPTFKVQNDCFCRPDLQQDAQQFVFSCVSNGCSKNTNDISLATSIYNDYCTSNGYERAQVTTPPNTESSPTSSTGTTNARSTATSAPGSSQPEDQLDEQSSSDKGDGLAGGAIAGIVVGAVSAVAAVIGLYFRWRTYKLEKSKAMPETMGAGVQQWGQGSYR